MGNRLSAVASTIDDHAKSCLRDSKRFGHFLGFEQQFTQQNSVLRRCFGETRYRLFRHQQHVTPPPFSLKAGEERGTWESGLKAKDVDASSARC